MTTGDNNSFDVCIVGAGIAGSTCAFYLAKSGIKTVILEKKKFPRDKICGDAITERAQVHLKRMGVLQEILDEKKGNWAAYGGIVSPGGIAYFGDSSKGKKNNHLVIAIKRKILDEKMVNAAVKEGAQLVEEYSVNNAILSKEEGMWTITTESNDTKYKAKILIIADGATSHLGRKLGLVDEPPQATCSRAYIEVGSHQYPYDGVCFYPPKLVPGYCSLFKEADGDIGYCCYIIPGGQCGTGDLLELHHDFIKNDPFMSKAIGPNPKLEKMKAAPIRFGGIDKSYSEYMMIIGDAAGQIDPLTGEGIQYAMDAAEIAAKTAKTAFKKNKFHERFFFRYHKRWMKSFGRDFRWSKRMINVFIKKPIFLDAFAAACNRKGDRFMIEWGKIMTGSKKKVSFFRPRLAIPLALETLRLKRKRK
ncbi:MAG TPA: NAD(P)/FAD-dependent oxidoreductase [Candidatus Bathyarchaeia archaeon]|nr:NAD(P)/FAD-dependent oxidoreductase [Candidatus Bathyarchaeia archaeon]